jgi:quercetin dioxygenase-like cupin family protein
MSPLCERLPNSMKILLISTVLLCAAVCVAQDKPATVPGQVGCLPVSARTGELGCWILADESLGALPSDPIFWHLDTFSSLDLAEKAKESNGTTLQTLGKAWLFTIAGASWRPKGGQHVADIGPLPVSPHSKYKTQYMEAIMDPGVMTNPHRHPGPEAWYTESGETCLETPLGKQVGRQGVHVIVAGGQPMRLTVTGTKQRRSLVLIRYDASQPWMVMASDWTPKGLCGR